MKKENYVEAELEIIWVLEDVITTSPGDDVPSGGTGGGDEP